MFISSYTWHTGDKDENGRVQGQSLARSIENFKLKNKDFFLF